MLAKYLGTAVLLLILTGCGGGAPKDNSIAIEKVPEPVMKVAREQLPDFTFTQAWKIEDKADAGYQLRGKTKQGKTREVRVYSSGKVVRD